MRAANERFWIGAAWGLVATLIMSAVMVLIWLTGTAGMNEPIPLSLAAHIVGKIFGMRTVTTGVLVLATIVHFGYGALWSGLLAASTSRVTWWKGAIVGLGLWVIMLVFFLPMAGADVFQVATHGAAWGWSLLVHVVYGVSVGVLAGRHEPELVEEPIA
jgi:hypothetical protein